MYFRNLRRSESAKPSTSRRRLRKASLSDSLSRIRMTASSPCMEVTRGAAVGLVVGCELQAQRFARLLEHQLPASVMLQRLLRTRARRHHRLHRAAEQELDLVHLRRILEPAEREHEPAPLAFHGNAAEAHEQLQRRLRPELGIVIAGIEGVVGEVERSGLAPSLLGHAAES